MSRVITGGFPLYAGDAAYGSITRFVVGLTAHIRKDALARAVNDTLPLFPHLNAVPVRTAEGYVMEKNSDPVTVSRCFPQEDMLYSGDSISGRMFNVTFCDRTVFFDIHNELLDEKGMASFAKSVIFRYLQLSGFDVSNDGNVRAVADGEIHVSEEDPMDLIEDIPASRPAWYMDAKAFCPRSSAAGPCRVTQIRIPLAKLKGAAKDYVSHPLTFISPVISQAVCQKHDGEMASGEYVVADISFSLRQYFPTLSFRPFGTDVTLAYNRRIGEYPFNTILMSQKKLLDAQLKTDALAYSAMRRIALTEAVEAADGIENKVRTAAAKAAEAASRSTYLISFTGNVGLPESMARYITDFYPIFTPVLHDFAVTAVTLRNEVVLTFAQKDSSDGSFCRSVAEIMNSNGIYAYVSDEFGFSPAKYELP